MQDKIKFWIRLLVFSDNALGKGMNQLLLHSAMSKYYSRLDSLSLVSETSLQKGKIGPVVY